MNKRTHKKMILEPSESYGDRLHWTVLFDFKDSDGSSYYFTFTTLKTAKEMIEMYLQKGPTKETFSELSLNKK